MKALRSLSLIILPLLLFPACMLWGSVDIPPSQVLTILTGGTPDSHVWQVIIMESRLPMALCAMLAGAALSVAGLLLQTTFNNPLAGPSILGISSGASLGVALVMLALGGAVTSYGIGYYAAVVTGAMAGAMAVLLTLLIFSRMVKSTPMLLIVGILVGYLTSSAISLLNFFATQEGVHSFVIWGMGSFAGITWSRLTIFAAVGVTSLLLSMLLVKPLNALLLGPRYAESMGVNIQRTRNALILLSGLLTAAVTAFCGPIGFLGLVVPHIARLWMKTSNHAILLPATALTGSSLGLLCTLLSVLPAKTEVVPINAITPVIGIPVIIYIILARKRLHYFN